jgi:hypothetical protein
MYQVSLENSADQFWVICQISTSDTSDRRALTSGLPLKMLAFELRGSA